MAFMDKYGKAISNTTKRYVSRAEPKTASNPEEESEPGKKERQTELERTELTVSSREPIRGELRRA